MPSIIPLRDDVIDHYVEAGKIASKVKEFIRPRVRPDVKLREICDSVEAEIRTRGSRPAFPCNVCVNEIAAHYTAVPDDPQVIPAGGLVKIDLGVHIDGFIVDTALTVNLSPTDAGVVACAEDALKKGISRIRLGAKLEDVGSVIETSVRSRGFKVIKNLTGHQIDRFNLHAGLSVPNVENSGLRRTIDREMVLAIEPFVTYSYGAGQVVEAHTSTIFKLKKSWSAHEKSSEIYAQFDGLPFCARWLPSSFSRTSVQPGLLQSFPILYEKMRAPVAQAEDTVLVLSDKNIIVT